ARTVVAEVIAAHVTVGGEPSGVIVDALARIHGGQGPALATRGDAGGEGALLDRAHVRAQVDQHPVEEVHAGQVFRDFPALLVDVVRLAGRVRIVADQRERACTLGDVVPREVRVVVVGQRDVRLRIDLAERIAFRNRLRVGEGQTGKFPSVLLYGCRFRSSSRQGYTNELAFAKLHHILAGRQLQRCDIHALS